MQRPRAKNEHRRLRAETGPVELGQKGQELRVRRWVPDSAAGNTCFTQTAAITHPWTIVTDAYLV